MNDQRQEVFVVFGEYCPEPYIEGVYSTAEKAEAALAELRDPDQYTIVRQRVY